MFGPADDVKTAVDQLLQKYKKAFHLSSAQVPKILSAVQTSFTTKYSTLLGVDAERSQFFRNAKRLKPATHDEARPEPAVDKKMGRPDRAEPADVLETALQGFVTDFGFRRALVLAPGTERSTLRVKAAWGEDAAMLKDELTLPILPSISDDLFSSAFHHAKDVVVLDAFDAKNTSRIARIYYEMLGSAVFVLYPCGPRGKVKLLFADSDSVDSVPKSGQPRGDSEATRSHCRRQGRFTGPSAQGNSSFRSEAHSQMRRR